MDEQERQAAERDPIWGPVFRNAAVEDEPGAWIREAIVAKLREADSLREADL